MRKRLFFIIVALNLALIVGTWINYTIPVIAHSVGDFFQELGRLAGLVAVFSVLLQLVLIGRNTWLESAFGLDNQTRLHKKNGYVAISSMLLHVVFLTIGYSLKTEVSLIQQFFDFITYFQDVLQAVIALCLFILTVGLSIYIVRKHLKYETWYYIHLFNYLAIFLAFNHQVLNGTTFLQSQLFTYYWYALYTFVVGNLVLFRILRPYYNFLRFEFKVEKVVQETYDTYSVYITGKDLKNYRIKAGQFMIFRFLAKGFFAESHPFSLSKSPDGGSLRISVKKVGDFTAKIAGLPVGTRVVIDGPYGVFTEEKANSNKILLIAGGIGITPIRSLLEQMAKNGKNIILLFGNKTKNDLVFKSELDAIHQQYSVPIHHIMSNPDEGDTTYLKGYIDKEKIATLVPDVKDREVYFCGPPVMMKKLIPTLAELGVPRNKMHYEEFSLT